MAKKVENDKGFLIIEMDYLEAVKIALFGFDGAIICDQCNDIINEECYYIAVLNQALCKKCCDDFISKYKRHDEDIAYEKRHYNFYAEKLELETV